MTGVLCGPMFSSFSLVISRDALTHGNHPRERIAALVLPPHDAGQSTIQGALQAGERSRNRVDGFLRGRTAS